MKKRIVFLDRDGTINVDYGYVFDPSRIELIEGAAKAIGSLKRAGFLVIVVSNQSAVGRGMASVEQVEETNRKLQELLLNVDEDAVLDFIFYSTDHPDNAGDRRKPGVGMLADLPKDLVFDLSQSWMVGDKSSDMEFGVNASLPEKNCIFLSGQDRKTPPENCTVATNLHDAVRLILAE